ncbi:hypothetical protein FD00_GL000678 [Liquorilactobacillus mali KCTC 3596 = DSM 20444]|uniref:Uncharacterized protein n=1 Tax=Liquorilactobacillus mali KCTC 3596 = DSM 20444 TaxID=1046596 RepID=A0A0R2EBP5_9LACO|nr:hypothetical protein FD00_GL000678 [Liquorilactobacillus mali KCTC 3596 = DSM 20444]
MDPKKGVAENLATPFFVNETLLTSRISRNASTIPKLFSQEKQHKSSFLIR